MRLTLVMGRWPDSQPIGIVFFRLYGDDGSEVGSFALDPENAERFARAVLGEVTTARLDSAIGTPSGSA